MSAITTPVSTIERPKRHTSRLKSVGKSSASKPRLSTKRTPLATRNVNTTGHAAHLARTTPNGDIVIYSPSFILKKDGAGVPLAKGSPEEDIPIAKLNFEQFRKKDMSMLGLSLSPMTPGRQSSQFVAATPVASGVIPPHTTPMEAGAVVPSPVVGGGELTVPQHLLLHGAPEPAGDSRSVPQSAPQGGRPSRCAVSPVPFVGTGRGTLSPVTETKAAGAVLNTIEQRFSRLETQLAQQEQQHSVERHALEGLIAKLSEQVATLNTRMQK